MATPAVTWANLCFASSLWKIALAYHKSNNERRQPQWIILFSNPMTYMDSYNAMVESLKLGPDSRREEFSANLPVEFNKFWKMTENWKRRTAPPLCQLIAVHVQQTWLLSLFFFVLFIYSTVWRGDASPLGGGGLLQLENSIDRSIVLCFSGYTQNSPHFRPKYFFLFCPLYAILHL